MLVVKVKIEPGLFDRAKRAAEAAGYSSVEEFIADCIEKEIQRLKLEEDERARCPTSSAAWDTSNDGRSCTASLVWLNAAANVLGTIPAGSRRRAAGVALRHGRRGGDGRALARRLQVHVEPARDQARPQRHQRQPAGPQAVQGQHAGGAAGRRGACLLAAGRLFVLAHRADAGHGLPVMPAPGPAFALVPGPAAPGRRGGRDHAQARTATPASPWPAVSLEPTTRSRSRPVRSACGASARSAGTSRRAKPGSHRLEFQVGDQTVDKELAIGDGFMRVSTAAPGLGLGGHPAQPVGAAVPARIRGPVDRDRLSRAIVLDQRHRLLGDLLVRRLDGRRPLLSPRAERQRLRCRPRPEGDAAHGDTRSSSFPACRARAPRS